MPDFVLLPDFSDGMSGSGLRPLTGRPDWYFVQVVASRLDTSKVNFRRIFERITLSRRVIM